MKILAIHAHPDDIEILAGGTMALLAASGHEVTLVSMTPGDCGSVEYSPEETAQIRRGEAAAAAALIGAKYICAEFRDLAIFPDDPSRRRVCELIREVAPEIVLTSSPIDYHCDHEATSALVRDACFGCSAPNYRTGGSAAALDSIPHLYYMDSIDGRDRDGRRQLATTFINVESVFVKKRDMLAAHASQRNWLRRQHGMDDYILQMEEWTRTVGTQCGVKYAEGFRQYPGHPYPQSPLLETLLQGYAIERSKSGS